MLYYIDGFLLNTPENHIFVGDPGTSFTIEMRDNTIEEAELQCRRPITLRLNDGCPITLPYEGGAYYYNNTSTFAVSEGTIPGTTEYRVQIGGGNNIKSLFATGTGDPNTKYDVRIHNTEGVDIWINKGVNPLLTEDTENPWSGDEQIDLVYYPDEDFWGWKITGGIFSPGDLWANITPTSTPPANINLRLQYWVAIRAYTVNPQYLGCYEVVSLLPPEVIPPENNFCIPGVDYICATDPENPFVQSPEYLPGVNPGECILPPSACL
jgi:hypothetical protein